jgi:hypothetical protein
MVVFDRFVQCPFVLDVVLLSVVILPFYREVVRRERKVFLDLLLEPLVGAESRRGERQLLATSIVVAFDDQRLVWPI